MDNQEGPLRPHDAEDLGAAIADLRRCVQGLTARVARLESASSAAAASAPDAAASAAESWSLATHSSVLTRIATVSFVLVVALVLRTLTDSGIVDQALGVELGIAYALLLIAVGWRAFASRRFGARVLTSCGAVLLCSIAIETHARLEVLPTGIAYALMAGALGATSVLGGRYRAPIVAEIGILTAAASALGLDFPLPTFHFAAPILVLAVAAAVATGRLRPVAWLPWLVLPALLFFWLLWSSRLAAPLARGEAIDAALELQWYLPLLTASFALLLAIAIATVRRDRFGLLLPTVNVMFACGAAAAVALPWLAAERALGAIALSVSVLHLWLATRLSRRGDTAPAAAMALAGVAAFAPGSWLLAGEASIATPLWALAALGLAHWSGRTGSGGVRALAAGLQCAATATAVAAGTFAAPSSAPATAAAEGLALAAIGLAHHRWTRRHLPTAGTWYARLQPTDQPGVATLWAALVALFGGLRVVLRAALQALPGDIDNTFAGAQSVLWNGIAMALLLVAHRNRDRSLLATCALVTAIAGIRVFAFDFLDRRGIPLVLSVFSFGVAAAVASLILRRWPRPPAPIAG